MLEYCYAANAVAFYYLFFRPQSAMLRRVGALVHAPCAARHCPALALCAPGSAV